MQFRAVTGRFIKAQHLFIGQRVVFRRQSQFFQITGRSNHIDLVQFQCGRNSLAGQDQPGDTVIRKGDSPDIAVTQRYIYIW